MVPDAVMIAFFRDISLEAGIDDITNETLVTDCIRNAIQNHTPGRRFVGYDTFRKLAFPDLPAKSAPRHPHYMALALERTDVQERISSLAAR